VRAVAPLRLDAVLSVKLVHRIEPHTQAVRRDQYVNVVRKFLLDRQFRWVAFVASHIRDLLKSERARSATNSDDDV
jgi:hypothetical protein